MPHIQLIRDVPGVGKAGATRAVAREAAIKFVEQGQAVYLDATGQPRADPPATEPEGKTTNDVDTPALQDPVPDTGTQPRRRRR